MQPNVNINAVIKFSLIVGKKLALSRERCPCATQPDWDQVRGPELRPDVGDVFAYDAAAGAVVVVVVAAAVGAVVVVAAAVLVAGAVLVAAAAVLVAGAVVVAAVAEVGDDAVVEGPQA